MILFIHMAETVCICPENCGFANAGFPPATPKILIWGRIWHISYPKIFFSMVAGCFLPSYNHGSPKVPKTPNIISQYSPVFTISPSNSYERISGVFELFAKHLHFFLKNLNNPQTCTLTANMWFLENRGFVNAGFPPATLTMLIWGHILHNRSAKIFLVWLLPFFSDLIHTNGRKFTRKPGICHFLDK